MEGSPAIVIVQRPSKRLNAIVALSSTKVEYVTYVVATVNRRAQEGAGQGGVNADDFRSFMLGLAPLLPPRSVIVLDNARIHHAELLQETLWPVLRATYGIGKIFLPAYSPFLNPIEYVFNTVKKRLENRQMLTFADMKAEVGNEFAAISPEVAANTFAHCQKYYDQAGSGLRFTGRILAPDRIAGQLPVEDILLQ